MIDLSVSGLIQTATFELMTRERRSVNTLDGVRSFNRERSIYSTPRAGGSLELTPRQGIDFRKTVVRVWANLYLGTEEGHYPVLTGIPKVATPENRTSTSSSVTIQLLDFTTLLDVPLGKSYSLAPGDIITTKVRALLESVGIFDAAITESSASASTGMYWSATETKRRVINELLKSIGYSAVWADSWGQIRVEPYLRPAARPVSDLGYVHGKTCTYRPEFTIEHDLANVPNHVVITARTDEPLEPVVGEAWLPPEHPASFESTRLEVPIIETDVDISVQALPENPGTIDIQEYLTRLGAAATAYAQRELQSRSETTRTFTVSNRYRPFELGVVAPFEAPARGQSEAIRTNVSVVSDSLSYENSGTFKVTTKLQEVLQ